MADTLTEAALEAAARALCNYAGHPEDLEVEGMPIWMSYVPEARVALEAAMPHLQH
jgi:hypothetical protein